MGWGRWPQRWSLVPGVYRPERMDGKGEGQSLKGKSLLRGRQMSRWLKMNVGGFSRVSAGRGRGRRQWWG